MRCLSEEQLARVSLGLSNPADLSAHLSGCARCRAGLENMQSLAHQLAEDYARFDLGHEEARDRLLASLPMRSSRPESANPWSFTSNLFGGLTMKRRVLLGGVGATVVLACALLWLGAGVKAKSYQFTMTLEGQEALKPGIPGSAPSRYSWLAPGSLRIETKSSPSKLGSVEYSLTGRASEDRAEIMPMDKPGIEIDHVKKEYRLRAAGLRRVSPLIMLEKLGTYSGQADSGLGIKVTGGKEAKGFAIDARKVDPDASPGRVEVWVDALSNLHVLIRYEVKQGNQSVVLRMDDFKWDVELDPKLFEATPPEGYAEIKGALTPPDAQVAAITKALGIFAEFSGGHYPRVKMVYGDVTRDELIRLSGVEWPPNPQQMRDKKVRKIYDSAQGFAWLNGILRDNADASYYGKTVGPDDKDKVLLRWKQDDGLYTVIFGDLRSETVTPARLRTLEGN
jgi:hypothetical protein